MWIAEKWQDYELLDCGDGEKLERWDKQLLVRPDPQAFGHRPAVTRAGNGQADDIFAARPAADTGRRVPCRRAGRFIMES